MRNVVWCVVVINEQELIISYACNPKKKFSLELRSLLKYLDYMYINLNIPF
jgi:hypothetical protein